LRANGYPWDVETFKAAAFAGNLELLKWLHTGPLSWMWNEETCAQSVAGNNFEALKWLHENGCPWGVRTCAFATDNLDKLQ
jgi:hypothetical protein|tara:strand:+ start:29125 stop:29367 length:243 start_codon:yes stop_codon:yes gene_type:complete